MRKRPLGHIVKNGPLQHFFFFLFIPASVHHEFVEKDAKKWWEKRNPGACDIKPYEFIFY